MEPVLGFERTVRRAREVLSTLVGQNMKWWERGMTTAVGQSAESVVRKTEDTKLRMLVEVDVRS